MSGSDGANPKRSIRGFLVLSLLVIGLAWAGFTDRLDEEPFFADESAVIAETFYYRLLVSGQWNHADWLHPYAYDHMPLGKYLVGFALERSGRPTPTTLMPLERWHRGDFSPPNDPRTLHVARLPMVAGAVFGCWCAFLLGRELFGAAVGLLFAFLLAISPDYFMHARRAMPDDWTQALIIATLYCFACFVRSIARSASWRSYVWISVGALSAGCAVGMKLNGAVACIAVGLFVVGALVAKRFRPSGQAAHSLAGGVLLGVGAMATFVAVLPYFFASPNLNSLSASSNGSVTYDGIPRTAAWLDETKAIAQEGVFTRGKRILEHRRGGLENGMNQFPNDALRTPIDRLGAIVTSGMGRWSALGVFREEFGTRGPGLITLAAVLIGLRFAWSIGRAELKANGWPIAWIVMAWPIAETLILLQNLTLDWDRYFLGVVAWTSLLSSLAIVEIVRRIGRRFILTPPTTEAGAP